MASRMLAGEERVELPSLVLETKVLATERFTCVGKLWIKVELNYFAYENFPYLDSQFLVCLFVASLTHNPL